MLWFAGFAVIYLIVSALDREQRALFFKLAGCLVAASVFGYAGYRLMAPSSEGERAIASESRGLTVSFIGAKPQQDSGGNPTGRTELSFYVCNKRKTPLHGYVIQVSGYEKDSGEPFPVLETALNAEDAESTELRGELEVKPGACESLKVVDRFVAYHTYRVRKWSGSWALIDPVPAQPEGSD